MKAISKAIAGLIIALGLLGVGAAPAVAADDSVVVVVRFFPSEGREEEAQARLSKLADFVPKANPGVTFRLHRSTKGPTVFMLYEVFPSQAALNNQSKTVLPAFTQQFGPLPQGLFAKPNEVEFFRSVND